jgi:hypothetical protein
MQTGLFGQKAMDMCGDLARMVLQRKMAALDQMQFGVWQVAPVCLGAFYGEERIVLPPHNQCGRLVLPEVRVPFVIQSDVGRVIVKQSELNGVVSGTIEKIWSKV